MVKRIILTETHYVSGYWPICLNLCSTQDLRESVYIADDSSLHHNLSFTLQRLSLCRQHLAEHRACFGELKDPAMAEEIAAAHRSTQQPVSGQRADSDEKKQEVYFNPHSDGLSEVLRVQCWRPSMLIRI